MCNDSCNESDIERSEVSKFGENVEYRVVFFVFLNNVYLVISSMDM